LIHKKITNVEKETKAAMAEITAAAASGARLPGGFLNRPRQRRAAIGGSGTG
jgi:hypothetical protein